MNSNERGLRVSIKTGLGLLLAVCFAWGADSDAVALSANIRARHMPFGTVLDPIFASASSDQIVGYTRCGDSALWTGHYLAAEAFRYKVTGAAEALDNVRAALAGLKSLVDVTGDNRLARCTVPAASPFAAGIESEEAHNTVHSNPPNIWLDNTSRDQLVGVFFGLNAAFDLVDDLQVKSGAADLVRRMIGFVSKHQWSPNDDIANTFLVRPEEVRMLVQIANHVNPSNSVGEPFLLGPVDAGVSVDVLSISSYFKFNLDYLSYFELGNQSGYGTLRKYTAGHQNALFNMVDRVVTGTNAARDQETRDLLAQWLMRQRRDLYVDVTGAVQVCGSEACAPVPVAMRPPTDYIWQRDPFQLKGGGSGTIESAGLDYMLPYWMARYYGVIAGAGVTVQSAAAPVGAIAPDSIASVYGVFTDGSVTVTDAAGNARAAEVLYASASQINFVVPGGTAAGTATVQAGGQSGTAVVQNYAPSLFTINGVAAATAIRVDGVTQVPVPVFTCPASGCVAVPIDVNSGLVYLSLYGTGVRHIGQWFNPTVLVGGVSVPVLYAGPAPGFNGLDQINVQLPASLRGSGMVAVSVGSSNSVSLNIQ